MDAITTSLAKHPTTTVVIFTAVVGLAAFYFFGSSSKKNDTALEPALTEELTIKVLGTILEKLKLASMRFLQVFENYKQQLASAGQEMEDRVLMRNAIYPHFKSAFQSVQNQVLESFDVEEDELEEATEVYTKRGVKEIIEISKTLKKLYHDFGGEVDFEEEEEDESSKLRVAEITLQDVVDMLDIIKVTMQTETEEYISAFLARYGAPSNEEEMMQFHQGMMTLSENAERVAASRYNLEVSQLHKSMMKFQDRQELGMKIMELQLSAKNSMEKFGLPTMG